MLLFLWDDCEKIWVTFPHKTSAEQKAKRALKSGECDLCVRSGPGEPQFLLCYLLAVHTANWYLSFTFWIIKRMDELNARYLLLSGILCNDE